MKLAFRKIIEEKNLWTWNDKLLLAVSGGMDSMVLLDLCKKEGYPIAVVHCNFSLRGAASDSDEALVKTEAETTGIPFHSKQFDTIAYASEHNISIEMAARDLRYAYFEELCISYGYTKIVTAHHANDNAETILLNLVKGTGIRGLNGIPLERGKIVRPLLSFTKKEIANYAREQAIAFREDKTNQDIVYQRNMLRNKVIPLLEKINPAVVSSLHTTAERMQELRTLYDDHIQKKLSQLVKNNTLSIKELEKQKAPQSLLYEWLSPYGFPSTVSENILRNTHKTEEKQFLTKNNRLIKSRGKLFLTPLPTTIKQEFSISEAGASFPIVLNIQTHTGTIEKTPNFAYFDKDKLDFPLVLRRWRRADRFHPFGMRGSKKVSELFKDLGLNTLEKEDIWILCSQENIIWIVGIRSDDRYKITKETKKAIRISFQKP